MIDPSADRRMPISPQLALRVASLGTVALVLFGIIFFRLWFLQVLSGDQFLAEATQNRVRKQPVPAPRGDIVDRAGNVLVRNRRAIVLRLDPRSLPEAERTLALGWGAKARLRAERPRGRRGPNVPIPPAPADLRARFARMRRVTGLSLAATQRLVVIGLVQEPFVPVILKEDVAPAVRQFVVEHQRRFRGVDVREVYLRDYPNGTAAAQVFGQLGEISKQQLGTKRYRGVPLGSVIGQNGLERTYDRYLRGVDGTEKIYVDASGRPVGAQERAVAPRPGRQLRTSLDLRLQKVAQAALARAAQGRPGAFVAMDPYTGEVRAMGSAPSFDPNELVGRLSDARAAQLFSDASGSPLTNRAVSSIYSTGSTFKPVTALAAMSVGATDPSKVILDQGKAGIRQNAKGQAYGPVDLRKALAVSSDVYFYEIGKETFNKGGGHAIQRWAHRLGFGRLTGVDTGGETTGVVPDAAWRARLNRREKRCRRGTTYPSGTSKAKGAPCGIADGTDRPYSAGDDVNLAIGQGDLQATPLQVALSYAAIATGGTVPVPHLGVGIEDDGGRPILGLETKPARRVKLPAAGLQAIRDGLHAAASQGGGTSADVFAGWDQGRFPVYGKTGTAQTAKGDQSWYAAYVPRTPSNNRPLLVVGTIERGGFGAEAAAPMVRQILSQWFLNRPGPFKAGESASL